MLERWEVKENLQFVKEDIIEGLDNEHYLPPILIPFKLPLFCNLFCKN